jgi:hypothetical protein
MTRAASHYKIIEKVNNNVYKLELSPEFEFSLTFNIAHLKSCMGEEDGLQSKTTPLQKREDEWMMRLLLLQMHSLLLQPYMQEPMTTARMRQLNLEVSSFLSDPFHDFENRLLPNDAIILKKLKKVMKCIEKGMKMKKTSKGILSREGGPTQAELNSISASR